MKPEFISHKMDYILLDKSYLLHIITSLINSAKYMGCNVTQLYYILFRLQMGQDIVHFSSCHTKPSCLGLILNKHAGLSQYTLVVFSFHFYHNNGQVEGEEKCKLVC